MYDFSRGILTFLSLLFWEGPGCWTEEKGRPSACIFGGRDAEDPGERAPGLAPATAVREEGKASPGTCRQQGTEMANRVPWGKLRKQQQRNGPGLELGVSLLTSTPWLAWVPHLDHQEGATGPTQGNLLWGQSQQVPVSRRLSQCTACTGATPPAVRGFA